MHVGAMMASLQYADSDPVLGVHGHGDVRDAAARGRIGGAHQRGARRHAGRQRSLRRQAGEPAGRAPAGTVEFDNVTFQYPGAEEPALSGVSFTARPGEVTAIIGGTGSGKSTLAGLIPRFYDVNGGRVLVDGVDVREMRQEDLRAKIGYVPQKAVLFSGTIASNIRFGREAATDDEVKKAATIAQAAEFIDQKPEGYAAPVAQGGTNLSGGQKQRLAIARALVRDAGDLRVRRQLLRARLRDRREAARRACARRRRTPPSSSCRSASARS